MGWVERLTIKLVSAKKFLHSACAACALLALPVAASAASAPPATAWVATWGAAQTAPYGSETVAAGAFDHGTLREVVHVSAAGRLLRLRLSNVFGQSPLALVSVHVARGKVDAATHTVAILGPSQPLTFRGSHAVTLPMGAEYLSDPLPFRLPPLSDLVIDIEIASAPAIVTLHAGARATSWWAAGEHAGEPVFAQSSTSTRWYFLAGVEVGSSRAGRAVVALGDSITDGHASTTDGNDRWPDELASRLAADPRTSSVGVVNAGIGGNRLLADGIGPDAVARLDRDVLARPGTRYLIVLEGVNDIGTLDRTETHDAAAHVRLVAELEQALSQLVAAAHEHNIRVYGGTVTPFAGNTYYHPDAAELADRAALNQWIRTSGTFDAVIDFDAALRDPAHPEHLLPAFDSGDHLHPGPAGYRRMGDAIPLALFRH